MADSTNHDDEPRELLRLVVGRIGKAIGLKGEASVEVRTDDPATRFEIGAALTTDPADRGPLTITAARMQGGRLVLRFAGFDDRSAVETLRNTMLVVEIDPAESPADPDDYYDHQLVGLRVVTLDGAAIGEVREMIHLPAQDLFAVRRADGREVLIPFVEEIVPEVDLEAGVIVVDPPPGLFELGDPVDADGPASAVGG
jgi:16S rRNA processing protein RimM